MPFVSEITGERFKICIWQASESIDELLAGLNLNAVELQTVHSFKSSIRQREWLAVRKALNFLNGSDCKIEYTENGKPFLPDHRPVSISHTRDFIAVLLATGKNAGIDIETIHQRILPLSEKFISEKEQFASNDLHKLQVIWGAKEVMFKIHGIGVIDFKKDLRVLPFEFELEGHVEAKVLKPGFEADFTIFYKKMGNQLLSWCTVY